MSHLLFKDDSFFFFRVDEAEVKVVLLQYEEAFGRTINLLKSSIMFNSNISCFGCGLKVSPTIRT